MDMQSGVVTELSVFTRLALPTHGSLLEIVWTTSLTDCLVVISEQNLRLNFVQCTDLHSTSGGVFQGLSGRKELTWFGN